MQVTAALKPGGLLLITSPFSWFAEYTAPERWLGGTLGADGQPRSSADGLKV